MEDNILMNMRLIWVYVTGCDALLLAMEESMHIRQSKSYAKEMVNCLLVIQ